MRAIAGGGPWRSCADALPSTALLPLIGEVSHDATTAKKYLFHRANKLNRGQTGSR